MFLFSLVTPQNTYLRVLGLPRSLWIFSKWVLTSFSTSDGSMSGTSLMENLPMTFLGITVFPPAPSNAPSIPAETQQKLTSNVRVCAVNIHNPGQENLSHLHTRTNHDFPNMSLILKEVCQTARGAACVWESVPLSCLTGYPCPVQGYPPPSWPQAWLEYPSRLQIWLGYLRRKSSRDQGYPPPPHGQGTRDQGLTFIMLSMFNTKNHTV